MGNVFVELVHWTWCLPQTLVGFLYFISSRKNHVKVERFRHAVVTTLDREHTGGFCWGRYIFIDRTPDEHTVKHEYGHTLQSFILGPLYIPLVWGRSRVLYLKYMRLRREDPEEFARQQPRYFRQFPENWADRLGNVKR